MTNQKKNNDETGEWEFSAVEIKEEVSPENLKQQKAELRKTARAKISEGRVKSESLALDEGAVPRTKTRSAMALEMMGEEDQEEKDEFEFAPLYKRGIAFILDGLFIASLLYSVKMLVPFWRSLIQIFLDKYKLVFWFPEPMVMNGILAISGALALFFFIVIPVAFFNHSFGKKIMGLKVRCEQKYTISISEAFQREIIMKPLSIIILAGFVTPFFSKSKLSIHDMIVHTLVIEE
ncbi:MAG: RDD family protein [Bacteriovorax sp.]|jgi:uncharacterized RDD family membrane protein YckC